MLLNEHKGPWIELLRAKKTKQSGLREITYCATDCYMYLT